MRMSAQDRYGAGALEGAVLKITFGDIHHMSTLAFDTESLIDQGLTNSSRQEI